MQDLRHQSDSLETMQSSLIFLSKSRSSSAGLFVDTTTNLAVVDCDCMVLHTNFNLACLFLQCGFLIDTSEIMWSPGGTLVWSRRQVQYDA